MANPQLKGCEKTLSQALGIILLSMVIASASVAINSAISKFGIGVGQSVSESPLSGTLLEHAMPLKDEIDPSACYALDLVIRNPSSTPIMFKEALVYIETREGLTVARAVPSTSKESIEPGGVLRTLFYSDRRVPLESAQLRISNSRAMSDSLRIKQAPCHLSPTAAMLVEPGEGEALSIRIRGVNITVTLDPFEHDGKRMYTIWFDIKVNSTLYPNKLRGEVLTLNYEHPLHVSDPVFHNHIEYKPGATYTGYWTPIEENEMPVIILWTLLN